ncbi:acyl-CoA thioesterase [Streptacidiphilus sp. P02-A3a]|uniref:acyl-CoA thioesterase n=1 Tax=Streptacidiphilus sp. P02-A3a TaxID=2704468 RepID=UPI0015FB4EED|nr:hotdog domain-containing protein [Streptacidiphilus sp. P02-A3a]QMU70766.1 acyl-CoA thioesterase [Streptacidiphilus sp. P02-A3a]
MTAPKDGPPAEAQLSQVIDYAQLSHYGVGHGRVVLELIDRVGGICSSAYCEGEVRTVAVSELRFLDSTRLGDVVLATARVDWVGRSSMDVAVTVTASPHEGGRSRSVSVARLVFVAVDEQGKPRPVPPLRPSNRQESDRDRDIAAWRARRAELSRELDQLAEAPARARRSTCTGDVR